MTAENGGASGAQAEHPLEQVCIFPLELPTKQGEALFHFALDRFSKAAFIAGSDLKKEGGEHELLLGHLRELLEQKAFKEKLPQGASFIFYAHEEHREAIEAVLRPYGATMIVDEPTVSQEMEPFLRSLIEDGELLGKPEDQQ